MAVIALKGAADKLRNGVRVLNIEFRVRLEEHLVLTVFQKETQKVSFQRCQFRAFHHSAALLLLRSCGCLRNIFPHGNCLLLGLVLSNCTENPGLDYLLVNSEAAGALLSKHRSLGRVRDNGYRICNVVDKLSLADRVSLCRIQQQVDFERDEILFIAGDIVLELGKRMRASEAVRVLSVRKKDNPHIHPLREHHIRSPEGCVNARLVSVIEYGEVGSEAVDEPYLLHRKRSAAGGNHIGDAQLLHSDHVHIALNQVAFVLP